MGAIEGDSTRCSAVSDTYHREIRLAVVMYGGVSLAIYMNGVARELLSLVRATAGVKDASGNWRLAVEDPVGTEAVYRQLGQIVGRSGGAASAADPPAPTDPVRTRFVIDILSGASAGGINAIFLGKALANGLSMDHTAALWTDEGDIELLINDKRSVKDGIKGLRLKKPPPSVLNGDRLLCKLYVAFREMDDAGSATGDPLIDVLDLCVTTTDIRGLPVPVRVDEPNRAVWENRHKHVFHFGYETGMGESAEASSDFRKRTNPMLAFAARCTSSFPVAFEPVMFDDLPAVLRTFHDIHEEDLVAWKRRFFSEYVYPVGATLPDGSPHRRDAYDPACRAFGDGGYLDNKPFGHAIDALSRHSCSRPVERKLLYIEPSPEHPEAQETCPDRPDAIANGLAAILLPRAETIREDLKRIQERNELVDKVERFLAYMERDFPRAAALTPYGSEGSLAERIERMGVAYAAYHRLKVAALSDQMAERLAIVAGYTKESRQFVEIRELMVVWRESKFGQGAEGLPDKEAAFLGQYDLGYRIRRLQHVMRVCDRLCLRDGALQSSLEDVMRNPLPDASKSVTGFTPAAVQVLEDDGARERFRDALRSLRGRLEPALMHLQAQSFDPEMLAKAAPGAAEELVSEDPNVRLAAISRLIKGPWRNAVRKVSDRAREICEREFDPYPVRWDGDDRRLPEERDELRPPDETEALAKWVLWRYYTYFENYDLVLYPTLYATDAGRELAPIAVHRISPEDATSLIDEQVQKRTKLAGVSLANFGAFLDRRFRRNDLLWGRLDGAERLITILLPNGAGNPHHARLLRQAHEAILQEHFGKLEAHLVERTLEEWLGGDPKVAAWVDETTRDEVGSAVGRTRLIEYFRDTYKRPEKVDPQLAARSVARIVHVVGKMLEDIGQRRVGNGKIGSLIARVGRWGVGIVEALSPDSLLHKLWYHWVYLIYLFEIVLIVAGVVYFDALTRPGMLLLGVTVALHWSWTWLGDVIRGPGKMWKKGVRVLAIVTAAAVAVLAGLGVWKLTELIG